MKLHRLACLSMVLASGALSAPAFAQDDELAEVPRPIAGGEVDILYTRLKSRVQYQSFNVGRPIELGNDVPADRYEPAYEVDAWVSLSRRWRLEGRYLGATYREHGTGRELTSHDGVVFQQGDRLDVVVDLHVASFGARVVTLDGDSVRLSLPFGVLYTQERLMIQNRTTRERGDGRVEAWTPYVGFGVDARLSDVVAIQAEARTFAYAFGRVDRHLYFELDVKVALSLLDDHLRLHTGPRLFAQDHHAEYSNSNDQVADFTMFAWQFGLTLDF